MSILGTLVEKYKDARIKSGNLKIFHKMLLDAVGDGSLAQEEIIQLEKEKEKFGLTEKDIDKFKVDAYLAAYQTSKSDGLITRQEENELEKIQNYLGVSDDKIAKTKQELSRMRLLNEIQNGNVPEIQVFNLIKQKNEKVYWDEPSSLLEEKVIRRGYVGGSQGFSFRIMKGVSYRVGSHRGQLVTETGILPVSAGNFIITSSRIILRGNNKSFAIKLDKILDIQLFSDGLRIFENNKSKPRIIQFHNGNNGDIVGSIISYSINNYGN